MSVAEPLHRPGQFAPTPEQRQVVMHGRGPLLVNAGPGSGKTSTLTSRIARLVKDGTARPSEILAMTFTNRAALEMRRRLADPRMLGREGVAGLTVGTFHSMCAQVVRQYAAMFGRTSAFTIYDPETVGRVVEQLLARTERSDLRDELEAHGRGAVGEVLRVMSLGKNRLLSPESYAERSRHPAREAIAMLWRETNAELAASNALDFDDLLVFTYSLLRANEFVLRHLRHRWPWLLVDEHQDCNLAQIWLICLLAGPDGNVTAVADDDQSIYRWRGAELDGTLRFGNWFPDYQAVVLGRNFRSHSEIVNSARTLIEHNQQRVPKALVSDKGAGATIETPTFANEHAEAKWVRGRIQEAITAGVPSGQIAIIARSGYLTKPVRRELTEAGIPHRVLGDLGFYERAVVRDGLAYLELLANPRDARALQRALQAPRRGVGDTTVEQVVAIARERELDLIEACRTLAGNGVVRRRDTRAALVQFADELDRLRLDAAAGKPVDDVVKEALLIPGGLVEHHTASIRGEKRSARRTDAEEALADLKSLYEAARSYRVADADATVAGFVQGVMLEEDRDLDGYDRVDVSSVHRAKGMEAQLVVVLGCEERVTPLWRSIESHDPADLEEERRVFYVAFTRAMRHLILTRVNERGGRASAGPSRFLVEAGVAG